jgi:hypothetical protein
MELEDSVNGKWISTLQINHKVEIYRRGLVSQKELLLSNVTVGLLTV